MSECVARWTGTDAKLSRGKLKLIILLAEVVVVVVVLLLLRPSMMVQVIAVFLFDISSLLRAGLFCCCL